MLSWERGMDETTAKGRLSLKLDRMLAGLLVGAIFLAGCGQGEVRTSGGEGEGDGGESSAGIDTTTSTTIGQQEATAAVAEQDARVEVALTALASLPVLGVLDVGAVSSDFLVRVSDVLLVGQVKRVVDGGEVVTMTTAVPCLDEATHEPTGDTCGVLQHRMQYFNLQIEEQDGTEVALKIPVMNLYSTSLAELDFEVARSQAAELLKELDAAVSGVNIAAYAVREGDVFTLAHACGLAVVDADGLLRQALFPGLTIGLGGITEVSELQEPS
ncbi:MAG: hypothetical protein JJLCMIEE_00457 [Acidimicrobiales bacterium]|nr:MAG: hypothetical protein EDR02_03875 [Actinomycetota bacterium]MBV6507412.1 hypothetical protein [Acidimicrobiales bacterium]RIK07797.1 MAG: hypothetical protein DCC48_02240 [Acidobacteriota bacterium]